MSKLTSGKPHEQRKLSKYDGSSTTDSGPLMLLKSLYDGSEKSSIEAIRSLKELKFNALRADVDGETKLFNWSLQRKLESLDTLTDRRVFDLHDASQLKAQQYLTKVIDAISFSVYMKFYEEMKILCITYPHNVDPHPRWCREAWTLLARIYQFMDDYDRLGNVLELLAMLIPKENELAIEYEESIRPYRKQVYDLKAEDVLDGSKEAEVRDIIVSVLNMLPNWFQLF